jgi:hypothetical protein
MTERFTVAASPWRLVRSNAKDTTIWRLEGQ